MTILWPERSIKYALPTKMFVVVSFNLTYKVVLIKSYLRQQVSTLQGRSHSFGPVNTPPAEYFPGNKWSYLLFLKHTFLSLCFESSCPSLPHTPTRLPAFTSTSTQMIGSLQTTWLQTHSSPSWVSLMHICAILIWEPMTTSFCPTFSKSSLTIHFANGFESFRRRLSCFFVGPAMSYHWRQDNNEQSKMLDYLCIYLCKKG